MTVDAQLAARKEAIVERSSAAMYADPFWRERFGERGERYTREDHAYHVNYLVEAVRSGDSEVFASYLRWLQPVLTSRGMCTKHLEDSLLAVHDAIVAEGIDGLAIEVHVEAARAALRYPRVGPQAIARAIQEAASRLAPVITTKVGRERTNDVLHLLSYVADAIALASDDVLVNHVRWLHGRTPPRVDGALLDAMVEASSGLDPEIAAPYGRLVAKAGLAIAPEAS